MGNGEVGRTEHSRAGEGGLDGEGEAGATQSRNVSRE